jgi:actin-binding LIM protein
MYSYLQDTPNLRRPIDPYDRKVPSPAMHFHLPVPTPVGLMDTQRKARHKVHSTYLSQLLGRRSRSHSRTGMRVMVEQMKSTTPRPRSPNMNNEEPINLSHYPDGRDPGEENGERRRPIERDDFPAPPFAYNRRRHHSEPGSVSTRTGSYESTPVVSSDEDDDEVETVDEKLEKTEETLRKISTGMMGKVFLQEIELDKQRRKMLKSRLMDPRSAARTPGAKREPHYRLRYDSPLNASPSRIADHLKPWDDDILIESSMSRPRSTVTPFLPCQTPVQPPRVVSPVNVIRPGYEKSRTLPARFSPHGVDMSDGGGNFAAYSTEFSSNRSEDLPGSSLGHRSPQQNIRVSSTYTQGLQAATPRSSQHSPYQRSGDGGDTSGMDDFDRSLPDMMQAPNIYPLHLLFTTNYRLPGDVDRCNLEKHLSDADFDMVFRMSREDFFRQPYWKRCDMKRKYHLF